LVANPDHYRAAIDANQEAQRAAGHYGVPLMALEGEPFFGQDRFDQLVWRLKQKGLQAR
jgi:2-hydroxychromene-2-carboxylate isomerase